MWITFECELQLKAVMQRVRMVYAKQIAAKQAFGSLDICFPELPSPIALWNALGEKHLTLQEESDSSSTDC